MAPTSGDDDHASKNSRTTSGDDDASKNRNDASKNRKKKSGRSRTGELEKERRKKNTTVPQPEAGPQTASERAYEVKMQFLREQYFR